MANRKPLVNNAGVLSEIPSGDAIQLASGGIRFSDNSVQTTASVGGCSGITRQVVTLSSSVTLDATALVDYIVFVPAAYTPTMPTAVGNTSQYTINNTHSSNITINTTSSQTINGSTSISIPSGSSFDLVSDGSNWRII